MSFSASPEGKIGWKELGFVEGQIITCCSNIEKKTGNDFWQDKLTIGKEYKIDDLEWRFWDRVCVVTDYSRPEFVPVEFFFDELSEKRNKTIDKILE